MTDQYDDDDFEIEADDVLRALPQDVYQDEAEATYRDGLQALDETPQVQQFGDERFTISPTGEPQSKGTRYRAKDHATGLTFYVGKVLPYGSRRGLSYVSSAIKYDRHTYENGFGPWAHFMWPTVMAESNGNMLTINAWDRAHFTWGFYQLAAHTPNDNFILLLRKLVGLSDAKEFFPDLELSGGKVMQRTATGLVNLEKETVVSIGSREETQIRGLMTYLNPDSRRLDEREAVSAARILAWAQTNPDVLDATTDVSIAIMKKKLGWLDRRFGLAGRRPEIAIWVSDMYHQGRGSSDQVRAALKLPAFEAQLEALSKIDRTGKHENRLKAVKARVNDLIEEGRFEGCRLGEGELKL